jgi:hypothetical protein
MTETVLDRHMALVGRTVAAFVSKGLLAVNIGSNEPEKFLGAAEDTKAFADVLQWMLDEEIIRAMRTHRTMDGSITLFHAQLTAKGIAIVKQPTGEGDTVEKRIRSAESGSSSWSSIGEMIGGFAAGFAKSIGSG